MLGTFPTVFSKAFSLRVVKSWDCDEMLTCDIKHKEFGCFSIIIFELGSVLREHNERLWSGDSLKFLPHFDGFMGYLCLWDDSILYNTFTSVCTNLTYDLDWPWNFMACFLKESRALIVSNFQNLESAGWLVLPPADSVQD